MRIGIITGEYPPMQGGVGAYTQILARELAQQGHYIHLFTGNQSHSDDLPIINSVHKWNIAGLFAIAKWARDEQLDILNLQFQTAAYQMSPWIHFLPDIIRDIPVVTTFHDLRYPYLFPKAGKLRDWIVMHLARQSAGVIVTNHEDLLRVQHLPHHTLIPIGSNILNILSDFDAQIWRTKAGAKPDDFLIAYFGFINRSKGVDVLLESLAQLRRENVPARLVIIGDSAGSSDPTNRVYTAEIEELINRLGLAPYIHRTGFVDDASVGAYLKSTDAVALPFLDGASFRRGSLMAAIHYGGAIVSTTPQVSIPTFVDGKNMLLVSPGDAPSLTEKLNYLYTDADLRARLQSRAHQLAKCFDWSQIARDTITFFDRVVGASA
jgi:glycosyltransferase involved in cell wall biosynthesis